MLGSARSTTCEKLVHENTERCQSTTGRPVMPRAALSHPQLIFMCSLVRFPFARFERRRRRRATQNVLGIKARLFGRACWSKARETVRLNARS